MFLIWDDLTQSAHAFVQISCAFLRFVQQFFCSHYDVEVTLFPVKLIICFPFLLAAPGLGPQERLISGGR